MVLQIFSINILLLKKLPYVFFLSLKSIVGLCGYIYKSFPLLFLIFIMLFKGIF